MPTTTVAYRTTVCLIWGLALWHSWECRGLFVDGSAFLDTAAVMKSLDLVVTCDTAFTHLAGALGVTAWLVLPKVPHWSWLLDREDTPWYPSVRIYRQELTGDWTRPFAKMSEELHGLIKRR